MDESELEKLRQKIYEIHKIIHNMRLADWRLQGVLDILMDLMEYIVNSTSIEKERLMDYDADEILNRVKMIINIVGGGR